MYKLLYISVLIAFSFCSFQAQSLKKIKKGMWHANLQLNEKTIMPFKLEVSKNKKTILFTVHNAEEKINLLSPVLINDSIQIDFPHFHSYIRFKMNHTDDLNGFWYNLNKGSNYKIPFSANYHSELAKPTIENYDLSGRWKTTFSPSSKDEEFAVGIFKSANSKVTGTFLTETGDYRFLEGEMYGNSFYLSCFDGSHAFYFTGDVLDHHISGWFFSGKHYQTAWVANKDEKFELRSPDSLTFLVKKDAFRFKMRDLEGKDFVFPSDYYNDKVTIIQIMGSWCPNCLDESKFFKEMYEKYHASGLEVISIGYETPSEFVEQANKIKMLKSRLNLDFCFLVGGQANKNTASEQFSMLNEIISFPTAIYVNKKGEVVKIHTGFSGPGTGQIYLDYKSKTEKYIQSLLK